MVATHSIKMNGKWYKAGEEAEDVAVEEIPLPFSDEDISFEERPEGKKYTKTDIMKMSKAGLQKLAKNTGVEGADEMSGTELKEYLLSVFGL